MTPLKKRIIFSICGLILFIAGTFIASDWLVYYFCSIKKIEGVCGFSRYQNFAKYSTTWLNAIMAWLVMKDGIDRKDTILLGLAFAFTVVADTFLVLLPEINPGHGSFYMDAGVITFMIVQTMYIIRHSRKMKDFFIDELGLVKKNIIVEIIWFTLIAAAVIAIIIFKPGTTASIVLVYAAFLITSLAVAWGTRRRSFYPSINAWMIAAGLTFFFFCDVNVGLATLPGRDIAHNLVWIFYTPALMLLSLSGYRWNK